MLVNSDTYQALIDNNVPKRFRGAVEPVKVDEMTWTKSFYLSGGVGRGKTHSAYGLFIWRLKKTLDQVGDQIAVDLPFLKIVNAPRIISEAKRISIEGREEFIDRLIDTEMLIIDDLGAEYRTDYSEQMIYDIVEGRYNNEKYTGFISNHEIGEDLPYEVRILSRIRGIVGNNIGVLTGEDRRVEG